MIMLLLGSQYTHTSELTDCLNILLAKALTRNAIYLYMILSTSLANLCPNHMMELNHRVEMQHNVANVSQNVDNVFAVWRVSFGFFIVCLFLPGPNEWKCYTVYGGPCEFRLLRSPAGKALL